MSSALIEARIPKYNPETKDYSKSQIDLYFINEHGSISNETGGSHVKNLESYEEAMKWIVHFIEFYLRGKILSIVGEE